MENKMIDIHSHLLYGIDDGSRNLNETISLLTNLKNKGVKEIILTPHYMEQTEYIAPAAKVDNLIKSLQRYTDIKLYIGNEVYISNNILKLLEQKQISTLNNSKYLLIELPMSNQLKDLEDTIYNLLIHGIIPIIAHPERYTYVQEDIKFIEKYYNMGVLFQGNYGSLTGKYGNTCKKTLKMLLKKNYISFMGTDIHRIDHPLDLEKAMSKLRKIVKDETTFYDITYGNMKKVIENQEIEINIS